MAFNLVVLFIGLIPAMVAGSRGRYVLARCPQAPIATLGGRMIAAILAAAAIGAPLDLEPRLSWPISRDR